MKIVNSINKVTSNDPRSPSIHGVYLDKENQKIVATNGHILAVLEPDEPITHSQVLSIPKMSGKELSINQENKTISDSKGLTTNLKTLERDYPQWQNLIDDKPTTFSIMLDAQLLLDLATALLDHRNTEKRKDCIVRLDFKGALDIVKVTCFENDKSFGLIKPCMMEY